MRELSIKEKAKAIKEKAKAYDEALEKARQEYNTTENVERKQWLEELFPELVESEDEKIRKELIDIVAKSPITFAFEDKSKVLSWLEKQGEQTDKIVERAKTEKQRVLITESDGEANIDWDTRSLQDVKLLLEYGLDYVNKLEKQGGEKPADKVEPKFKVGNIIRLKDGDGLEWTVEEVLNNGYYTIVCADRDDFIQLDDKWELVEQKPVWSEEDENTIKVLMNIIRKSEIIDSIIYTDSLKEKLYDWLKSLRPQPKQEWSEEDEKMLNRIIEDFSDGKVSNILEIYWLKSIKQRIRG